MSYADDSESDFLNLSFMYSEKVTDGSVNIRKQSIIKLNCRQGKIVESKI